MSSMFNNNGLPTFIHPLTYAVFQRILTVAAAFTPPSSNYRFVAAAILLLTTWSYLSTCHIYMENRTWKSIWGFVSTQFLAVYTERLLVSQWNWKDRGPRQYTQNTPLKNERPGEEEEMDVMTEAGSQSEGKGQVDDHHGVHVHGDHKTPVTTVPQTKFAFAIALLFGTRGVNTPWQAKNTPPFSSKYSSRPPSRLQFLARRCLTLIFGFLIMDFGTTLPLDPKIFALDTILFFARLSHVTFEEMAVRTINTIALWVINYAFICFFANCWAVFAVGLGWSRPEAWPPGFGNMSDAWTLRRYWGVFWHQHFRTTLEGLSGALTRNVLRLGPNSLLKRYTKLLLAFAVSGCMHVGHDVGGAVEARGGAMHFFCTQFVGMVIEDTVQALFRYGERRRRKGTTIEEAGREIEEVPSWKRWVGRVWVAAFLVWSTPTFEYPVMLVKRKTGDEMLPFSVAKLWYGL